MRRSHKKSARRDETSSATRWSAFITRSRRSRRRAGAEEQAVNVLQVAEGASPGTLSPDEHWERQPCFGLHQAGIVTPQQAAIMLVAFDVLADNRQDLERLFRLLTARITFLTTSGQAPAANERLPPMDSGILGASIYPDNLTITVSVGDSLFDQRFGLTALKPLRLQVMHRFPNDALDGALCHGELLLKIFANNSDMVTHALRDVIKHTPDLLSIRWKREGFISSHAARSTQ